MDGMIRTAVLALLGLVAVVAPLLAQTDGVADEALLPEAFPEGRYALIWEKSPFTLASAAEEPVAGFTNNLVLVGLGRINDMPYVRIMDRTSQTRFTVGGEQPHNGIELVDIEPSDDPGESTARLRRGGETGVVRFDPNMLASGSAPQAIPAPGRAPRGSPGANAPRPTAVNNPQQTNNANARDIPTPRRRRVIIPSSR